MNTKKDIPQKDIPPNGIPPFAKEIVKDNTIFALSGNIKTQITNNTELDEIKLDEDFKKNYGALKSQRTVVIANALEILKNMRQQFENNFENDGREQI